MGNLSVYRLRLASGRLLHATKANLARFDDDAITWHEDAWVSWDDTAGAVLSR